MASFFFFFESYVSEVNMVKESLNCPMEFDDNNEGDVWRENILRLVWDLKGKGTTITIIN